MSSEEKKKEFLNSAVGETVLKIPSLELTAFPAPRYTISLAVLKVALGVFFPLQGRRRVKEWSSEQSCSAVLGCREQPGQGACARQYGATRYLLPWVCYLAQAAWSGKGLFHLTSPK